ncbi:uncharacterized protein DUF3168 [Psychrobacillus insolitus]|uniref:Uncharacterized protein DUF3168 n=1 Tax=Psychrobacillus insolitus TaxID=1461 RepID=A0A2W7MMA4_9BACI|nr:DUF3168 domain-containing protein [Psychrobacillus insolitus]PZX07900.1 uncharacterized protein DUF3168 [Psychrobacillus insolitus]
MSLAFAATHQAIYSRLLNDVPVTALVKKTVEGIEYKGVYDHLTEDTPYPYIVIGEPRTDPFEVKNTDVEDVFITLHIWSNYSGKKEAYDILSACHEAFKYKLAITGHTVIKTSWSGAQVFDDIDATLRHGVITLKFTLSKGSD